MPLSYHCLAKMNDTHAILVGGRLPDESASDRVFVINFSTQVWTEVEPLSEPRDRHTCQMVESENQERGPELIVVGGGTITQNTTEIYSVLDQEWRMGPDFPIGINRYYSSHFSYISLRSTIDL